MIIGGAEIKSYKSTRSWGVNPGGGTAVLVLPNAAIDGKAVGFQVGSSVAYSFYGVDTFYGIVSKVSSKTGGTAGTEITLDLVDNRVRLAWMFAFAAFNMEDETYAHGLIQPTADGDVGQSNTSSSGGGSGDGNLDLAEQSTSSAPDDVRFPAGFVIDPTRRRRYWSILPKHWASHVRTYHDQPYTARQIMNECFAGAEGHKFSFTRRYGSRADQVRPLGLDWLKGVSLASMISQMNDKTGMDVYIEGRNDLRWDVKGVGSLPLYNGPQNPEYSIGVSMTTDPTRMRVVGSNTIVQVMNIELFPTWNRKWEQFMGEAAWLREVASRWNLDEKIHWAEIAARAREITLGEYCAKANDMTFADYGSFGFVKRMSMSAWAYMEEVVFKHYAVNPDSKLFGSIPLDSLRIADALHCAVEMEGDGLSENTKMRYQRQPVEFYPGAKSFVIAKGQPLDAFEARDIQAFHALRTTDTRKTWRVMQDYDIDPRGVGVTFKTPVFIDGDPTSNESIFLFPNRGQGGARSLDGVDGVEENSELLNIVVPNGDYKITPAVVKACFCFEMAPFFIEYGSGPRFGVLPADGLTAHVLHMGDDSFAVAGIGNSYPELMRLPSGGSDTFKELLYADGDSAKEKAYTAWRSREGVQGDQTEGGFLRFGIVGTRLGDVVDRVSIDINAGGGISETVDFIRARPTRVFIAEKTMQRLQRISELHAGHEQLKQEVRNLRRIVEASRFTESTSKRSISHKSLFDLNRAAIGGGLAAQTKTLPIEGDNAERKVGQVLWVDQQSQVNQDGTAFGGIILHSVKASTEKSNLEVAYGGSAPMLLKGKFKPGGIVYVSPGVSHGMPAASTGSIAVGTYTHVSCPKDDEPFYGIVRLGFGGAEAMACLQIYNLRKEEDEWKVNIRPGYVISINPKQSAAKDMIKYVMPTPLDQEDELPTFTVKAGEKIAVKVTTDEKDIVTSAEIVTGEEFESKHAYPPPSGSGGVYHYWLASFKDRTDPAPENGAASVLEFDKLYHCGGPIYHRPSLNELSNLDDGGEGVDYEIYSDFNKSDAKHELRKLWQMAGEGHALLMDKDEDTTDGDNSPKYLIRFRRLMGLSGSDGQIKVELSKDGKTIEIKGNGNDNSWIFTKNGETVATISHKDGLHTGDGGTIELCCESKSSSSNSSIP